MATQSSLRMTSSPKAAFVFQKMKQWDPQDDATSRYKKAMQNPSAYPHETAMMNAANMVAAMRLSRIKLLGMTAALLEQQRKQEQLGAVIQQENRKERDARQLMEQEPEIEKQVLKEKEQKLQERLFEDIPEPMPEEAELEEHAKNAAKKMEDVEKNIDTLMDKRQQIKKLDNKIESEVKKINKQQDKRGDQFEKAYGHKLSDTEKNFLSGGDATESFLKQYAENATPELEAKREAIYDALDKAHPNKYPEDKNYSQFREMQLQRNAMLLAVKDQDPAAIKANKHTKALDTSMKSECNHRGEVDKLLNKREGLAQDAKELVNKNDGLVKEIQDSHAKMKECASAIEAKQSEKNQSGAQQGQSPKNQGAASKYDYVSEALEAYQKDLSQDVGLMDHPQAAAMKGLDQFMAQHKEQMDMMKKEIIADMKKGGLKA